MSLMNIDMKKVVDVTVTGFGVMGLGQCLAGLVVEPSAFLTGVLFAIACTVCIKKLNN